MSLEGKVALVTGSAQGIGKSIALVLARDGADCIISDVNLELAEKTAEEIRSTGRKALSVRSNVVDAGDVAAMMQAGIDEFGKIDILVNNAGITRDGLLMRMKDEDWDQVLNVNLKGAFLCIRAVSRTMMKKRSGRIINIASIVGAMGNVGQANYVASKAGLIGLTKTVARELASRGVTCNAVAPGFIETAMTQVLADDVKEKLMAQIPMGRLGSTEDVAHAVRYLASDDAAYITGQVLHVNGGMYM
jgi:3-oxoacyl-[acyl-carrier protein] reductase